MCFDENLVKEVIVYNCPQGKNLMYFLVFSD
jgi:hypothetical protein